MIQKIHFSRLYIFYKLLFITAELLTIRVLILNLIQNKDITGPILSFFILLLFISFLNIKVKRIYFVEDEKKLIVKHFLLGKAKEFNANQAKFFLLNSSFFSRKYKLEVESNKYEFVTSLTINESKLYKIVKK